MKKPKPGSRNYTKRYVKWWKQEDRKARGEMKWWEWIREVYRGL